MALRRSLDDGVARTGVVPRDARLGELADAAATQDPQLPSALPLADDAGGMVPRTVWTDGSCLNPRDPLLARAGWGLRVAAAEGGEPVDCSGPVGGTQTAQRAEVVAALAASRVWAGPIDLATDSQYVVQSCARLRAGESAALWAHGDLWDDFAPAARSGRVVARWVPAHKTADDYTRRRASRSATAWATPWPTTSRARRPRCA